MLKKKTVFTEKKRAVSAVLGGLFLMMFLCGVSWGGRGNPCSLENIQERGALRVGLENDGWAYFLQWEDGTPRGFCADLALALGEALELPVHFVPLSWGNGEEETISGFLEGMPWKEVDLVASVVTVLPEREEKVRFSMPYALVGQMVLLRGSLPGVLSIESLQNQRVGFPWKTTSEVAAQDLPSTNSLVPLQNGSLALESFLRGDVDAIVIDSPVALTFLYEHPEVKTLDKLLTRERYALVFPSDADPRLVAQANDVIRKYRDTLEKRWIP